MRTDRGTGAKMDGIVEADRVEVLVLVDNVTDALSTNPPDVEAEWPRLWRTGMTRLAGRCLCCAAHGLSCAITAWRDGVRRTLLFDTGPDADVFERNVDRLAFGMGEVDAMVLSHGHWDHAGAMPRALELIGRAAPGRRTPVHLHPGVHATRATQAADGTMRPMEDVPTAEALEARGGEPVYATGRQAVLDGLFAISGEIPRVVPFEKGLPGQLRRTADGTGWEPDPWLVDERFVAVRVRGRGVLVFTACSHAGVVNVLRHARTLFGDEPLHAVLGGFHLSGTNESIIPDTVEALRGFALPRIVPAHCTGWRAVHALVGAFGDAVAPSAVGKTFRF
jgi:7,8-dihydropterin-6-yl-methyl-4-(beta-D-ribofuranosyl)aminobenzene 5'-phosphate synthase